MHLADPAPTPTSRRPFPTYDFHVNAIVHSDGLNDADEMNLYTPNPLIDSPFGPSDMEWLYRQQDVDGATLSSRLQQLAPVSFTNGLDGARRRQAVCARFVGPEQLYLDDRQSGADDIRHHDGQRYSDVAPRFRRIADSRLGQNRRVHGRRARRHAGAGPSRQEDQPELSAAGLERPQRADPAEVDQRRVSASQVGAAAPRRSTRRKSWPSSAST